MILSFKKQFKQAILDGTKIHTIREDPADRWNDEQHIHYATGVRTKHYQCFKEGPCVSTQEVLMTYAYNDLIEISVDDTELFGYQERLAFAKNDGFETWEAFFDWFYPLILRSPKEVYIGKLIHFTDKRY